jgi:hypothetical protein
MRREFRVHDCGYEKEGRFPSEQQAEAYCVQRAVYLLKEHRMEDPGNKFEIRVTEKQGGRIEHTLYRNDKYYGLALARFPAYSK